MPTEIAERDADVNVAGPEAVKRRRVEAAKQMMAELLEKLWTFANEAKPVNAKITKEEVAANRKYWNELKEVYARRDEIINAEEGLWASLICCHPQVVEEYLVAPVEVSFLREHLKSVALEDFMDENGSYQITFTFNQSAENLVEPLVWTKKVVLMDDCETVDEDKSEVTTISFKTDGLNPIKGVEEMKKSALEQLAVETDDMEELPIYSVATWFSEAKPSIAGEFGEIFRRFVYPNPESILESVLAEEQAEDEDEEEPETSVGQTA